MFLDAFECLYIEFFIFSDHYLFEGGEVVAEKDLLKDFMIFFASESFYYAFLKSFFRDANFLKHAF